MLREKVVNSSSDQAAQGGGSRVFAFLAAATRAELLAGIAIGVGLAIAGHMALTYEIGRQVLAMLLAVVAVLILGAVLGYTASSYFAARLKSGAGATLQDAVDAATQLVSEAGSKDASPQAREDALRRLGESVKASFGLLAGLIGRGLAFGRLAAMLGAAISFAVFLATYMQVDRLDTQNRLMEASNHLQEASRRTLLSSEIEALGKELPEKQGAAIDPATIQNLVNLSVSLRPYRFLEYADPDTYKAEGRLGADTGEARLSDRALSSERGRLLLRLLRVAPTNLREVAEARPDFSRADLRGTRVSRLNFSDFMLASADFRDAEGFATAFRGAQLPRADFSGAELIGGDFSKPIDPLPTLRRGTTDLRGAKFVQARLPRANFSGADLTGADFTDSVLFNARFDAATLRAVILNGAALAQADSDVQKSEAVAAFVALISLLPEEERSHWESEVRTPGPEHKYLGSASGNTNYLFIVRRGG